ncbi:MAG TPA: VapC toxin family PIN domain ribonuclease [Gammaproteobacteria bacterium]|nr:VapC toxin family PIN domain ribonuclease [Gammaproteobacteria bacterium]MBK83381.1 VapC toxin family PIN domain ribonuclease [Gammaproteobacteria bacterium]HBF08085.1 VapC toxin family PIN domain ribonuclease [Gammaproteobacteria bacterium]HCK91716.1 VapC toxin family PIN domain ribonuclease [Gammaproteobacteria bacterium]|tara:strand:+ start:184 stop:627 length:444 start_codon:yes stop_codon:yes gene_type:complete
MFLLDTNVVSELRKAKSRKANENVVQWANQVQASRLFISVITVLELETGILQFERKDPEQGRILRSWFESNVLPAFEGRILELNTDVARKCAKLHVPDPRSDRDAMIAATALMYDMTVVTRNTKDFKHTGAKLLNPWNNQHSKASTP